MINISSVANIVKVCEYFIRASVGPENFCGIAKKDRFYFSEEFSKQKQSWFSEKFKGHFLFSVTSTSWHSFRTLLVRERLKCSVRIESSTNDESVESFRGLVNSRNFERVRRQIIGVNTCRNICCNFDIPRGSCCSVRISVPSDIALRLKFIENISAKAGIFNGKN